MLREPLKKDSNINICLFTMLSVVLLKVTSMINIIKLISIYTYLKNNYYLIDKWECATIIEFFL